MFDYAHSHVGAPSCHHPHRQTSSTSTRAATAPMHAPLGCLQIAKSQGAFVATTCSGRNTDFVTRELGADLAIDYTKKVRRGRGPSGKPAVVSIGEVALERVEVHGQGTT